MQQTHWAIPVGTLSAGRAAVETLPGHVYVAGFNLPSSWSVCVPLAGFLITLSPISPGPVAPGCLVPNSAGAGQFGFGGHLGCHPAVWSLVCQTPASPCVTSLCLLGCRLCDPPQGPSLPQSWITQGHFRVLVALSQPQPLGRGGSGLHSRFLTSIPVLSLGNPCTLESLSPSEKGEGN